MSPVLPAGAKSALRERMLDANDVHGLPDKDEGILKTINLQGNATETRFLVVIGINKKGNSKKPAITYKNQELTVVFNGRERIVKVSDNQSNSDKPLLEVINN